MWLPPTPPTDDIPDYYIDYTLELSYDTTTVMTPDALLSAAIHWYGRHVHVCVCV